MPNSPTKEHEMKTAEETAIQLFAIFNGANIEYAQNIFTNHMDVEERKNWLRLAEYGTQKHLDARISALEEAAEVASAGQSESIFCKHYDLGRRDCYIDILSLAAKLKKGTK